MKDKILKSD
jgi:hypothetical protein